MEDALNGLNDTEECINDVGIFEQGSFEQHLQTIEEVLTQVQDANFAINPLKCEWEVQETDFLGFWLTPVALKPWKKKIQATLDLAPPTNAKQVRGFIGAVTFHREMFPRCSQALTPLC